MPDDAEERIITLWIMARRIDPARPAATRALEVHCRRADPPIWTERDEWGIRCCLAEDQPRIAAELAKWRGRPRLYPHPLKTRPRVAVAVAAPSPFAGRSSPWRRDSRET